MTTTPTSTPQDIIDGYFECWNATDADARAAAIARTWTEEATSSDPLSEVTGHDELAAMMDAVRAQYPGHSFRQVGQPDGHHDLLRWSWEMVDAEGAGVVDGFDVALRAEDGRLSYLAGFFGASIPTAVG
jgi:hypothetical protein